MRLTKFQKQLCNVLQKGLPIYSRPFAPIADVLNSDENTVLQQTSELKSAGIIRRISALIDYRVLGKASTLVAAHIPQENLLEVVEAVNSLKNVSHNYLREHYYNLWFTLQAQTNEQIGVVLSNLSAHFDIDFHNLPAKRIFKLDARFDAASQGQMLLQNTEEVPKSEAVKLNEKQVLILSKLQCGLDVVAKPFDFLHSKDLKAEDVIRIVTELIDKGVIRRIAAVVDHRKLGFVANVLFVCEVPQNKIVRAGKALARLPIVSHCYQRKTVKDWPCNLFAMMHNRSMEQIQQAINKFIEAEKIDSFQLLPTVAELKKQPVKYRL